MQACARKYSRVRTLPLLRVSGGLVDSASSSEAAQESRAHAAYCTNDSIQIAQAEFSQLRIDIPMLIQGKIYQVTGPTCKRSTDWPAEAAQEKKHAIGCASLLTGLYGSDKDVPTNFYRNLKDQFYHLKGGNNGLTRTW
ncbi:hypothetical protein NDU88_003904 [Pleurodeles waltl]|uniref:Uncharacterized protein n=1 Tax=Pleurodeles waltl TaxID=8319 RepID=A0AAV7TPT2_PLEWA|nr:hypothetical protein NDU88_003904 [Pleurodeles waltl]